MAGQITQPIITIDPSKAHVRGKDALQMNVTAAMAVANTVKSTFGPSGMDKMLVDVAGDVTITNDGETILRKIAVEHYRKYAGKGSRGWHHCGCYVCGRTA